MKSFKNFFGSMFGGSGKGNAPQPGRARRDVSPPAPYVDAGRLASLPHKKGDFIGQKYEVYGVLGKGGFGVVYLVYSHETRDVYALKTFRDEYLADAQTRERFRKEAQVWVDLDRHPYLLRAHFVDEAAGRLYVATEYIAPDEQGLNSLDKYLQRRPPDLAQSLRWAIQFCYGMEHAYSKGLRCHRDIKPANILISQDRTVKIADFGLAGVLGASRATSEINLTMHEGRIGLSGQTMDGASFGTPTHMPPEQFVSAAACDERSDIYSFGIVLYQMATGGRLPFLAAPLMDDSAGEKARFWQEMQRLHEERPVPPVDSTLFPLIQRCLAKKPGSRYESFQALREDLEPLLRRETGEAIRLSGEKPFAAWEWNNKGNSLAKFGRYEEAITCWDRALTIDPLYAHAWNNKGNSLDSLGRYQEAIACCDRALAIDPQIAPAWVNWGKSLDSLGRYQEAAACYDRALDIDPQIPVGWLNKGASLAKLGRDDEAIACYDRALAIDPQHADAWNNKGASLAELGRDDEAIACYDRALAIDPQNAAAWNNRGTSLRSLGRHQEAIASHDRALANAPQNAAAWFNKALAEEELGRRREAARSYQRFIALAPAQYAAQIQVARQRLRELGGS